MHGIEKHFNIAKRCPARAGRDKEVEINSSIDCDVETMA